MSCYTPHELKTDAVATRNTTTSHPLERPANNQRTVEAVPGELHGVDVISQYRDSNAIYNKLYKKAKQINNINDDYQFVGKADLSWTDGEDFIGFRSSKAKYGVMKNGGFTRFYKYHIAVFADQACNKKKNSAKKRTLRIEMRDNKLTYSDGNKMTWVPDWHDGQRKEGTYVCTQASYSEQPGAVIKESLDLLFSTGFWTDSEEETLRNAYRPTTTRFRGMESHHRYLLEQKGAVESSLRDTQALLSSHHTGEEEAMNERGHTPILGFTTDNLSHLGYDETISYQDRDGNIQREEVSQWYIKTYEMADKSKLPENSPLKHPKIEIKAQHAFPITAWGNVKRRLDEILNSLLFDVAGVTTGDLVSDSIYKPHLKNNIRTPSPAKHRDELEDFYQGQKGKEILLNYLTYDYSAAPKDILLTLAEYITQ